MSNVTQVIKSVRVAEDDSKKSVRALESALESIGQSMQNFYNEDPNVQRTSPEALLLVNRAIAEATSKAVAASNSRKQEDIVTVANTGRQVIGDLLKTLKVCILTVSFRGLSFYQAHLFWIFSNFDPSPRHPHFYIHLFLLYLLPHQISFHTFLYYIPAHHYLTTIQPVCLPNMYMLYILS